MIDETIRKDLEAYVKETGTQLRPQEVRFFAEVCSFAQLCTGEDESEDEEDPSEDQHPGECGTIDELIEAWNTKAELAGTDAQKEFFARKYRDAVVQKRFIEQVRYPFRRFPVKEFTALIGSSHTLDASRTRFYRDVINDFYDFPFLKEKYRFLLSQIERYLTIDPKKTFVVRDLILNDLIYNARENFDMPLIDDEQIYADLKRAKRSGMRALLFMATQEQRGEVRARLLQGAEYLARFNLLQGLDVKIPRKERNRERNWVRQEIERIKSAYGASQ
ncbi:hypothetical protein HY492_00340 [Candidatus Woesearchaeota archaeon]|nr:hypothetical protein [Candidatus Woesearchaeota archaeon]